MKIYQVWFNADFTEGRGPMLPGPSFLNREDAAAFIDSKPGIMGIRRKWSEEEYGDWEIREVEVHESLNNV